MRPGIVRSVNGRPIRSMEDLNQAFQEPSLYDVIVLEGLGAPIVLERSLVTSADQRIMKNYGLPAISCP